MGTMKTSLTDNQPLPPRWRNLVPLTGLIAHHIRTVCALANQQLPPAPGRPWGLPLPVRVLLVLIHLRTNLTTRALAALFDTSQSAVDRVIHHLMPVLARALRPAPGNRNHVIVARATVAHLLDGARPILGDGGYRGIPPITTPRRDHTGRIIHDDHYRAHRRIRARVEHVLARLKDWQIPRQSRRRGEAINHSLQTTTGLWNLKTHKPLRVTS
jgi:hypothetical protein